MTPTQKWATTGLAGLLAVILATAALFVFATSEVDAQSNEWQATCPTPPSTVVAGVPFSLEAKIQPESDAASLSYRWEIENIGEATGQNTGSLVYAQASDGQAQRVTMFVTDGTRMAREQCRGIVTVNPGDIVVPAGIGLVQDALDQAGPNATIFLDRGTHKGNLDLTPQNGQTIRGLLGTNGTSLLSTLDGAGLNTDGGRHHAITTNPSPNFAENQSVNVTINQLEIEGYKTLGVASNSGFFGVIHVQTALTGTGGDCTSTARIEGYGPAAGWDISNVWVHDNEGAGVYLASDTTLRDSVIENNDHIGIGGSLADTVLIDNVRVTNNALTDDVRHGFHAGGLKMTRSKNVQILNSTFSGNGGPGIWFDLDMHSSQIRNNVITGNLNKSSIYGYGIFQEVSWSSLIAGNTTSGNEAGGILNWDSSGYVRDDGATVLNVIEDNQLNEPNGLVRDGEERECTWRQERSVDPNKTRLPGTSPTGYFLQYDTNENNTAAADGAAIDQMTGAIVPVAATPYVPRIEELDPGDWQAACPVPPSYVRVGETFLLEADIDPPSAAAALSYRWEIENTSDATGRIAGPISYAQASDGQAQRVTLFVTGGGRTDRVSCRGIVTVDSSDTIVDVGESLQTALNQAGVGATVFLDRGAHTDNVNVTPLNNQTIRGFLGTNGTTLLSILDGTGLSAPVGNERHHAITSNPADQIKDDVGTRFVDAQSTGVTINQLEIRNYRTFESAERAGFYAALHVQTARSGSTNTEQCVASGRITGYGPSAAWDISNVWVHSNQGAGVILATDTALRNAIVSDNQHIGIGGSIAENIVIDDVTVENNALADEVLVGNHSGGLKITRAKNLQILNSRFSNNRGPGIWLDIDVHSSQVRNNVISGNRKGLTNEPQDNYGYGIFQEISWPSLIADNTITNNETGAMLISNTGGYVRADSVIVQNVVENNRLENNPLPIDYRDDDRNCVWLTERSVDPNQTRLPGDANPSGYTLQHNLVEDNDGDAVGAVALPVTQQPYVPRTVGTPVTFADGDVDCDGALSISDVWLIVRFARDLVDNGGLCPVPSGSINAAAGDLDGDGVTDVADAVIALQCVVGDQAFCPTAAD